MEEIKKIFFSNIFKISVGVFFISLFCIFALEDKKCPEYYISSISAGISLSIVIFSAIYIKKKRR